MRWLTVAVLLLQFTPSRLHAQGEERRGAHELQSIRQPPPGTSSFDGIRHGARAGFLDRDVFGYHPYWMGASILDGYRYELLSVVAYFSAELEPGSGSFSTIHDWLSTPLIEKAHRAGSKVVLCVTNFGTGNNALFLTNGAARDTMIAELIRLLQQRGGDGVNIDFEPVGGAQRAALVSFLRDLNQRVRSAVPGAHISVAAPAVDWNQAWDVGAIAPSVDHFFVMCYDYHWSGSDYAGPVSPLQGTPYNVQRTIDWYLSSGVHPEKILLGVPYYGYEWPVVSDAPRAKTIGTAVARTYSVARDESERYGRRWDGSLLNPWYSYNTGNTWYQCWYDDSASLELKYDYAVGRDIGGIGIWALGYDRGREELWDLLARKFYRTVRAVESSREAVLELRQNHPNPFSESTSIPYRIPAGAADVTFGIYDLLGREVVDLTPRIQSSSPGSEGLMTLHRRDVGRQGVYLCRLSDGRTVLTKMLHCTVH